MRLGANEALRGAYTDSEEQGQDGDSLGEKGGQTLRNIKAFQRFMLVDLCCVRQGSKSACQHNPLLLAGHGVSFQLHQNHYNMKIIMITCMGQTAIGQYALLDGAALIGMATNGF